MAETNIENKKNNTKRLAAYWGAGLAVLLLDQLTKVVVDWRFPLNWSLE